MSVVKDLKVTATQGKPSVYIRGTFEVGTLNGLVLTVPEAQELWNLLSDALASIGEHPWKDAVA